MIDTFLEKLQENRALCAASVGLPSSVSWDELIFAMAEDNRQKEALRRGLPSDAAWQTIFGQPKLSEHGDLPA